MKTFFNILQTLINKKDKIYPDETNPFLFELNIHTSNDAIYVDSLIQTIYDNQKSDTKFIIRKEY